MAIRPETHRPRALARRAALLDAAVEIVGERGIAAATHRAVAARAGLPPSTTSYFFESIDELLATALRERLEEQVQALRALTATIRSSNLNPDAETIDGFADAAATLVMNSPRPQTVAQFEVYLQASRDNNYSDYASEMFDAFESLVAAGLKAAGAENPTVGARAIVALTDGLMLQHLARGTSTRRAKTEMRAALAVAFNSYLGES